MADAWPPQITEYVGRSRLRWASGLTRRANSCLAIGDDDEIPSLVAAATAFYARQSREPVFFVSAASAPPSLAAHLSALGYSPKAHTRVLTAAATEVAALAGSGAASGTAGWTVDVVDEVTDDWFEAFWDVDSARSLNATHRTICRDVLLRAPGAAFASVVEAGKTIAVGQLVVNGLWAGVQCMATAVSHRRRGAASAVLGALATRSIGRGVANMYLAVMDNNAGARRLYEQLGFSPAHEYSYYVRTPATTTTARP